MMSHAAKLVARHLVLARVLEARSDLGNETGHDHCINVGDGEQEAVHDIGAAKSESHRRIRRHAHAVGHEIKLHRDEPHSYRTIGLEGCAQIAFDELAVQMKRLWVNYLDIARRVQRVSNAGHYDNDHHNAEHAGHYSDPALLGAHHHRLRHYAARERTLQRI